MATPDVPGYGVKRAAALFEEKGYSWKTVVEAFADKEFQMTTHLKCKTCSKFFNAADYDFINKRFSGPPPPPITKLTMEQEFKMRQIEDAIRGDIDKEDIITVFLALQRQCYVLVNNMSILSNNGKYTTRLLQAW